MQNKEEKAVEFSSEPNNYKEESAMFKVLKGKKCWKTHKNFIYS